MSCDVGEVTERLENELCCTSMSSAHSPTFPSLHQRHSSFSNRSVALPTSQLILQPCHCFTNVTDHSPTILSLLLRQRNELCSYSKLSVSLPMSQFILQPFRRFTYVTSHYPTIPLLHLRHSSFSNRSFASSTSKECGLLILQLSVSLPMSQLILQPHRRFTYDAAHSPTLLSLLIHHRFFTYVSWRAAHDSIFKWAVSR